MWASQHHEEMNLTAEIVRMCPDKGQQLLDNIMKRLQMVKLPLNAKMIQVRP